MRDGRVEAAGPTAAVTVPAGATRVDLSGKTIVPGLINAHAHVNASDESTQPVRDQLLAQLRLYADYGVTTAFVLGRRRPTFRTRYGCATSRSGVSWIAPGSTSLLRA